MNDEGRLHSAPANFELSPSDGTTGFGRMAARCDSCNKRVYGPYDVGRFQGRRSRLCGSCLERVARGVAAVERAVRKAA